MDTSGVYMTDTFGNIQGTNRYLYFAYYSNGNVPQYPPNAQKYTYDFYNGQIGSAEIRYNYAAKTITWTYSYPGWGSMTG